MRQHEPSADDGEETTTTSTKASDPTRSDGKHLLHRGVIDALTAQTTGCSRFADAAGQTVFRQAATRSTRGPALAGMRASAKSRQGERIHVRMLHDVYRIISIQLSPSYTIAIAVAESDQHLIVVHLNGSADGQGDSNSMNERSAD